MTSKRDIARYDALLGYGCVACKQNGDYRTPEMHHIVDKGYRKHSGGNQATLPLCEWHHRGVRFGTIISDAFMTHAYGPSLAHSKSGFVMRFGSERELLEQVNQVICGKRL